MYHKKTFKIFFIGFTIISFVVVVSLLAQKKQEKVKPTAPLQLTKKADLIIEKIQIEKIAQDPAIIPHDRKVKIRYKVKISITVKNKVLPTSGASTADSLTPDGVTAHCGGASKLLLEWTEDPTSGFHRLGEAGISALAPGASKTVSLTQWVPKGAIRKYRATADHLNWIREYSETNNIKSAGYVAR